MTPPLCIGEGCSNPVKRRRCPQAPMRGPRIVDGISWSWFCSKRCSSHDALTTVDMRRVAANNAKRNRRMAEERALKRLVALCKDKMDDQQRVHVKDMVRVMMAELRQAKANASVAAWNRLNRERAA